MFHGSDVFNRPLTNWRGSSLTNMKSMFQNATKFNQPLSELDVASVLYMQDMFNGATSFDQSPFCETSWVKSTADKTSMFIGVHQGKICCGPGNYSTGDTTCTNCPTGMYMDEASVLPCKYCEAGTFFTSSTSTCEVCGKGKYQAQNEVASAQCLECPPGKNLVEDKDAGANSHNAESDCQNCRAGRYNHLAGLGDDCFSCDSAKSTGATSCGTNTCNPGTYKNGTRCVDCPGGYYTRKAEAENCRECPRGFFQATTSTKQRIECDSCPRGQFGATTASNSMANCQACSAGRYSNVDGLAKRHGSIPCDECPAGTQTSKSGSAERSGCLNCPVGRWSNKRAAVNESTCIPCKAGRFSAKVGVSTSDSCLQCKAGLSQRKKGQAFCLECAPGRFQPDPGQDQCHKCPTGFFQNTSNSVFCHKPEAKFIASRGGVTSVPISQGWAADKCGNNGVCEEANPCPEGTFEYDRECKNCPAGYSSFKSAIQCSPCAKGKFADASGMTCEDCPRGYFQAAQNAQGSLRCEQCPAGYQQNGTGESACVDLKWKSPRDCSSEQYLNNTDRDPQKWECTTCPQGGSCSGDLTWSTLGPMFGWWKIPPEERSRNFFSINGGAQKSGKWVDVFAECMHPPACIGGHNAALEEEYPEHATATTAATAAAAVNESLHGSSCNYSLGFKNNSNSTNRLCQSCRGAYSRSSYARCTDCEGGVGKAAVVMLFLGAAGVLVGFVALIGLKMKSYRKFDMNRRRKAPHSTLKRIILSHIQMISLVLGLAVPWPTLMFDAWSIITAVTTVSDNANSIECLLAGERDHAGFFYGLLLVIATVPLVFVVLLAIYWLVIVRHCGDRRVLSCGTKMTPGRLRVSTAAVTEDMKKRWREHFEPSTADTFIASSVFFWFIILPSLVRVGAAVFQCLLIGRADSAKPSYLAISLQERCWEGRHLNFAVGVGFPMLVFYAAIVPGAIALRLRELKESRLNNPHMMLRWGFFHSGCKFNDVGIFFEVCPVRLCRLPSHANTYYHNPFLFLSNNFFRQTHKVLVGAYRTVAQVLHHFRVHVHFVGYEPIAVSPWGGDPSAAHA